MEDTHAVSELLASWNSFYVMIGASAATLTGLMFVVITLVSDDQRTATKDGISTFSTPTVVHFCCALFTAVFMLAPFHSLIPIGVLLCLSGAGGTIHATRIMLQARSLQTYEPDLEDWMWHFTLPLVAYCALFFTGIVLHLWPRPVLFAPAAAVTLLIFIGIHNAWDVVTYLARGKAGDVPDPRPERSAN